jgi:hypothetical protein
LWQVVQLAVVETWFTPLPVAFEPSWQFVHVVALVNVLWSALAPVQIVVDLWQLSQFAVVDK